MITVTKLSSFPCGSSLPVRSAAFTLIELVVTLAIAALIVGVGLPAFHDWLAAVQLADHAKQIAESMTRARTEAIRRGHRVNLCKAPDRRQCINRGGWDAGYIVYVDVNRDGQLSGDESILAIEGRAPPGITVAANRPLDNYVSYTSLGHARMLNGALQMGTFTVCRTGQRALHVVLAGSGRVRIEKSDRRCP